MILAGDIGGTNTRLAIFDPTLTLVRQQVYSNQGHASFIEIARNFLTASPPHPLTASPHHSPPPDRAAFGVAGPVIDGRAAMTNLPWILDAAELSRELGIARVAVINDLVAHAEGVELLRPDQLITIQPGKQVRGHRAVIAAGTGLGEAGIFFEPCDQRYHGFACEGGHCDFAPRGGRQIKLMQSLLAKYPNASWERVLSGPGLRNLYDFLISDHQLGHAAALPAPDPAPADISQAGLNRSNAACTAALDIFIACYGAESANLALKMLARGGVYIGGGIAPRIAPRLTDGQFIEAFLATGPPNIRALLHEIPVHIVSFELNGLYGAANHARRL